MTTETVARGMAEVILEAHKRPYSVKGDYARNLAEYVAMAACEGLLSTRVVGNVYSREWRPTHEGLKFLEETLGINTRLTNDEE